VLQADVPVKKLDKPVEQLTMTAPKDDLVIAWDVVQVSVPISYK